MARSPRAPCPALPVLDLAPAARVEVPITEAVEAVCYRGGSPQEMVRMLMSRSMKSE